MFSVGVLTISDKGASGERADRSGQVIKDMLRAIGGETVAYEIVPDEAGVISRTLAAWADDGKVALILTTGGTGLSRRDVTPEATLAILDRVVPGIPEAMRLRTLDKAPTAILSRAVAGMRKECLIVNLPGNPKAVRECLEVVLPAIPHGIEIMKGIYTEHPAEKT